MAEYIDREKVIDTLYAILCKYPIGRNPSDYEYGINCAINFAKDQIENIPVADVQPVVHGEWIKHGVSEGHLIEKNTCSECNYYSGTKTSNFCPNCGADMRGIEDGETN